MIPAEISFFISNGKVKDVIFVLTTCLRQAGLGLDTILFVYINFANFKLENHLLLYIYADI